MNKSIFLGAFFLLCLIGCSMVRGEGAVVAAAEPVKTVQTVQAVQAAQVVTAVAISPAAQTVLLATSGASGVSPFWWNLC